MEIKELLYEGKAKKVYNTTDAYTVMVSYKDDATAFNGIKKGTIHDKGKVNNEVSNKMMMYLEEQGVKTHYIRQLNERDTLVKRVDIIPLEVIMRNKAAGSLAKRLGLEEGTLLKRPVLEFCLKDDDLGDPFINDDHILSIELATEEDIVIIKQMARTINALMKTYFEKIDIDLIDIKLEFGRTSTGEIILADEISPDTCRYWDMKTGEKLDKDRFRRDLGKIEEAYMEVYNRIFNQQ
ncbi:phosphoribosylaminoimidazole-succinocarboxamide synthase [Natranaerovirga hydrolytica]|uniref:Phosphoribosylaminoimidazole-succinocarboxamide synthase n=1 Tax=Natranaerovirga hydrolytica TaxID=680378 RepID=A0A4R1MDF4_9FIRM|nr:phosphoribosylaminoimidazolesuccinocarboxamide synthase [Natranaerovirga hydrolytica]TCK90548.1 phosphoribosylaminoimidazole-succinocarboxamide synthase [Natranaerovirga hydrolytica]